MGTKYSANGQRQIVTLNFEISTVLDTKPRTPQKTFQFVMGKEQFTRPKTCKIYYDDYGDDMIMVMMMTMISVI